MQFFWIKSAVICAALAGCATESSMKPTEALDERTGMTVASMQEPIELIVDPTSSSLASSKRTSFAYLGPIEWNRMGTITYGLWIHVAPGNDQAFTDIRAAGATTLVLDGTPVSLQPIDPPKLGLETYHSVVPWGQTAYFDVTPETLKRMASSNKLMLTFREGNDNVVNFLPTHEVRGPLTQYVQSRGITAD